MVIAPLILDLPYSQPESASAEAWQVDRVGLCHVVINIQRDLSRGHSGLIDLKAVILGGEIEVGRSDACRLASKRIVGICERQGEGNGSFVPASGESS